MILWVDNKRGNDTTGAGTYDKPFKTLPRAIALAGTKDEHHNINIVCRNEGYELPSTGMEHITLHGVMPDGTDPPESKGPVFYNQAMIDQHRQIFGMPVTGMSSLLELSGLAPNREPSDG